jgi:hypothetical protein
VLWKPVTLLGGRARKREERGTERNTLDTDFVKLFYGLFSQCSALWSVRTSISSYFPSACDNQVYIATMVRVISEKLFSPPRSRHSSGETVDKELAARAVEALPSFSSVRKGLELCSDYESSSDSHWDSEVDFEGEGPFTPSSEAGGAFGEDGAEYTGPVS